MQYLIIVNDSDKKRIIKKVNTLKELIPGKIMGYREFLKKIYFDYTEEAVVYIVEKYQVTKEIAEIYLQNLYYLDFKKTENKKITFLTNLYQDLKNNHKIIEYPIWKNKLKKLKIVFYHITKQDKYFINTYELCQKITDTQIINQEHPKITKPISVIEYANIEQEVEGTCTEIIKKIKEGYLPNQIYLTNLTETHRNLLKTYGNIFSIPFHLKEKSLTNSSIILVDFLNNYSNGIEESIKQLLEKYSSPEETECIQWIISICNRYSFIKQEDRKKDFILEDLKKGRTIQSENANAIQEINFQEQELESNEFLFILNVNEGKFPRIYKDDEFLSDVEKEILNIDKSDERNEKEKKICLEKINAIKNIQISYSKKEESVECYPSSILEKIPHTIKTYQEDLVHSHLYNQILLGRKMDELRKYGTQKDHLYSLQATYDAKKYNSYQNDYHKINETIKSPIKLSYTTLDTFFHCSFRYYLDNILKLNLYEETFDKQIGTLFHQILKESYEPNFDFEKSWKENAKNVKIINAKEKFFLEKLKEDIQRDIFVIEEQDAKKQYQVMTEVPITYEIENTNTILKGIIDKIYWKKENNETWISLIDYKTGTPNTNLDYLTYGLNLQLPIYLLLLKKLPLENIKIIGFYLQKILPQIKEKDKIHTEEELKRKNLMLQGYSVDVESRIQSFDPTYENSKLISGMKKSSKGFYAYSKILSEEQIEKMENIVNQLIKKANQDIQNFNFPINPKRIGNKLIGCDYCKYQDICYRKEENIDNLKETKLQEIVGGKKDANMDERTIGCNL